MSDEGARDLRDDAFHVTAALNMPSIAAAGFRIDRRGVLGTGAYFDLESEQTGWAPARQRYPGEALVVFRCEIRLGRILDLNDPATRARFQRFQRGLVGRMSREDILSRGQGGHVDLFLESLADEGISYDTVMRTFTKDGLTRVAVRDAQRVRVISVRDEQGRVLPWPPRSR